VLNPALSRIQAGDLGGSGVEGEKGNAQKENQPFFQMLLKGLYQNERTFN